MPKLFDLFEERDNSAKTYSRVAKVCSICGDSEFESDIMTNEFWICPKCVNKLKKIIDREEDL